MAAVAIVTVLALAQFYVFSVQVGQMRGRHGVSAPAITGAPEFERMFRIQQNTMEQLVILIPSLWLFAYFASPLWAAGLGLVFIVGRFVYRAEYLKDPASRQMGFMIGIIPLSILLVGALIAAGMNFYAQYMH